MGPRRQRRKPETPRRRPASPAPAAPRRGPSLGPRRHRVLREIRILQKSTHLLLRKNPFCRLAREICVQFTRGVDFNWQAQALLALQEHVEVPKSRARDRTQTTAVTQAAAVTTPAPSPAAPQRNASPPCKEQQGTPGG
ncbi:histone H3-like centromeric protein A isoform X1 [Phacochoerus africanus]|uniref:histone H3-like centromeric protein A isoform X1 n=1 Tax=Phacochoerus africanus TaxID=41426 RepID=UPI001FD9F361|nr:histone H3-like centromeric protein A isoform X1 [Phacochoerus africanus]